jgi:2-polyprenyl-3-methyl-5-hydroxy-6-metoxy-1,4-benzoquinol methylase
VDKTHRKDSDQLREIQSGNETWWTQNTMSYDWEDRIAHEKFSAPWFDEVDRRFVDAARLFATDVNPFDRLIPFSSLRGRRVLEIGCGMGFHAELLARAGAVLTTVDLSPTSVETTQRRLDLRGLQAEVVQCDAETLPFADDSFDFVWSWGVIHHSSRTSRIVRQIARVLQPDGETRIMVYNRHATTTVLAVLRDQLLKGGIFTRSFEESLYATTDGYSARFYVREQFEDLFRGFFRQASCEICGQEVDAIPLPRLFRALISPLVSENYLRRAQAKRGAFLFLRAKFPE